MDWARIFIKPEVWPLYETLHNCTYGGVRKAKYVELRWLQDKKSIKPISKRMIMNKINIVTWGKAAQFLPSTTLALGVISVYLAPAADSHSFGFQFVPPLHCIHLVHPTIYNLSPFAAHTGMSVGKAKLYGIKAETLVQHPLEHHCYSSYYLRIHT